VTQDHVSPISGDSSDSLFETTMRGYNKRQVDEYIVWLRAELSSAQEDARAAREQSDETARDVQRMRDELSQARAEASSAVRPQHEEVSERLAQILRLADEEADQKRARAVEEADSTLEAARDQSAKVLEAARSAAEGIISAARARAEKEAAAAKAEAEALLASAASSSQATIDDAEQRAARVLADADQRTGQITSLQDERLAALREVHTDTLRRLEVVRGALEKVLTAEIEAGPPDSAVDAAPLPAAGTALRAVDIDLPPVAPATLATPMALAVDPEPVDPIGAVESVEALPMVEETGDGSAEDAEQTGGIDLAAIAEYAEQSESRMAEADDESALATGMISRDAIAHAAGLGEQGLEAGQLAEGATEDSSEGLGVGRR
jgi:cell division septum initiation protein DivIVA